MAVAHGKSTYFNLDTAGGSPTDLSAYGAEVNANFDIAMHDTTAFGSNSRTKITGLKDGKFSVTFHNDPTLQSHLVGLYGNSTSSTFIIGPQGSTGGFRKITGECWLASLPIVTNVDDAEKITAQFEVTGDTSFTTF